MSAMAFRKAALAFAALLATGVSTATLRAETVSCCSWDGKVDTNIKFSSACTYFLDPARRAQACGQSPPSNPASNPKVFFEADNVTLDCNGGTIDGAFGSGGRYYGLVVGPSTTATYTTPEGLQCKEANPRRTNVTIKNCTLQNLDRGISLRREFRWVAETNAGGTLTGNCTDNYAQSRFDGDIRKAYTEVGLDAASAALPSRPSTPAQVDAAIRAMTVANLTVTNVKFKNNEAGLYVHAYATLATVSQSRFENNAIGIYLDHASRDNVISDSVFVNNAKAGVAIDSSKHNQIVASQFSNHPAGAKAIQMFKNCGETGNKRTNHTRENQILGNTFSDNEVGVWMGSRQGIPWHHEHIYECRHDILPENGTEPRTGPTYVDLPANALSENRELCGQSALLDPANMAQAVADYQAAFGGNGSTIRFFRDYVYDNEVISNTFVNHSIAGVIVWDDDNRVEDNTFSGVHARDVCVGNQFRKAIGQPVAGTMLNGNRALGDGYWALLPFLPVHGTTLADARHNTDASATTYMLFRSLR